MSLADALKHLQDVTKLSIKELTREITRATPSYTEAERDALGVLTYPAIIYNSTHEHYEAWNLTTSTWDEVKTQAHA
jgi:hypothetical protein